MNRSGLLRAGQTIAAVPPTMATTPEPTSRSSPPTRSSLPVEPPDPTIPPGGTDPLPAPCPGTTGGADPTTLLAVALEAGAPTVAGATASARVSSAPDAAVPAGCGFPVVLSSWAWGTPATDGTLSLLLLDSEQGVLVPGGAALALVVDLACP